MRIRSRVFSLAVAAILAAILAWGADGRTGTTRVTRPDKPTKAKAVGLVARQDFDIGETWRPNKIIGKDFWHILGVSMDSHPDKGSMVGTTMRDVVDEPLFAECGLSYRSIANITVPGTDKVAISAMALELATAYKHISPAQAARYSKKYLSLIDARPNAPFFLMPSGIRPIYRLMKDFDCDYEGYRKWKEGHPNFMGCTHGETDNGFLSAAPWRNYWWPRRIKKTCDQDLINTVETEFPKPKNREELAAQYMKALGAFRKFLFSDADKTEYLRAAHCHDHYYYESGANMVWLETTNTASANGIRNYRHQSSLFFSRGAARQYAKNWGWYIAVFYNGYDDRGDFWGHSDPDYRVDKIVKGNGRAGYHGPDCGMSPSLLRRDAFLAYLSGASFINHESWGGYMKVRNKDGQKTYDLSSPMGQVWQEWFEFTRKNPDRGASYAPVALLVPFAQGYPNYGGKSWHTFDYERPDWMIDAFLYTIMPHSPVTKQGDEGCLANGPYGDIYDVVVPNPPSGPVSVDVLDNYKVAAMLGKYPKSEALAQRLMEYVKSGGTLLLNVEQLNEFFPAEFTGVQRPDSHRETGRSYAAVKGSVQSLPDGKILTLPEEYEMEVVKLEGATSLLADADGNVLACTNQFGKGNVILSTVRWMVPKDDLASKRGDCLTKMVYGRRFPLIEFFLKEFVSETLPMEVRGDIQYGMNRLADGWLVYLINNKGVTKFTNKAQSLDVSKTAKVQVSLRKIRAETITELRRQEAIQVEHGSNSFTIEVPPGGIRVVRIEEGK